MQKRVWGCLDLDAGIERLREWNRKDTRADELGRSRSFKVRGEDGSRTSSLDGDGN